MEINDARRRAHRPRKKQCVEQRVALEVIEQEPQQALHAEIRIRAHEPAARVLSPAVQEIGDGVARRQPVLQRSVNAARGQR
ncbi:hypothetical protein D3C83_115380 [compost metagenome]